MFITLIISQPWTKRRFCCCCYFVVKKRNILFFSWNKCLICWILNDVKKKNNARYWKGPFDNLCYWYKQQIACFLSLNLNTRKKTPLIKWWFKWHLVILSFGKQLRWLIEIWSFKSGFFSYCRCWWNLCLKTKTWTFG